ncbi:conserved protein of unknown function [Tenacibaculum sp. 190524A02b]|uniref:hypothetical protein n=1 Tax=Tenacibaculum vairaonense TaxID=3137860 RepID=UPI0032B2A48F
MIIEGVITQLKVESNPPKRKVKVQEINENTWWVEVRGQLRKQCIHLKEGDRVIININSKARENSTNTFNNIIAQRIERIK